MSASVVSVCAGPGHHFSKPIRDRIRLVPGMGVEGDGHAGATVRHRSRVRRDPTLPNLRQVHLLQAELFDQLSRQGFAVGPGDLGENVTTRGVDLLALPTGAILSLGDQAMIEVTGLRNPCKQIDGFQVGLMAAVLDRAPDGSLIRKAGVMAVVLAGGEVWAGAGIAVQLPNGPPRPLQPV